MSEARHGASQSRRAALMAHALPRDDQAWLLAALPASRRSVLEGLLAELKVPGIPPDPALLESIDAKNAPTPPASAADLPDASSGAQVPMLAQVLQQEDPTVAACLLALRPWGWRDALLAAMPCEWAEKVKDVQSGTRAPALEAALCEALLGEVRAASRTSPTFTRDALLRRLRQAVRAMGGRT
ncbi:hypothetical protein HK414_26280 [Ramlibacter terrae]|uniref:Flagellar motor switch protein FliG middle domain-containing protein n=1 Tax=Ramlibacter terrae TaxID=2732511 RepID=A0ABX6P631_9BURK|nr:hypothetical protein HK414_26280 [Ramlibacter terrae]